MNDLRDLVKRIETPKGYSLVAGELDPVTHDVIVRFSPLVSGHQEIKKDLEDVDLSFEDEEDLKPARKGRPKKKVSKSEAADILEELEDYD